MEKQSAKCKKRGCTTTPGRSWRGSYKWCKAHCPHPKENLVYIPTGDDLCTACGLMW